MIDKQALLTLLDDEILVQKYLERFSRDMPLLIQQMQQACQLQHWNDMQVLAHSYRSQMQYIQDRDATETAYELDRLCSAFPENQLQVSTMITSLEHQLNITLQEISQIIG